MFVYTYTRFKLHRPKTFYQSSNASRVRLFFYITMVLGQPAGLSEEGCLCAGAGRFICQRRAGGQQICYYYCFYFLLRDFLDFFFFFFFFSTSLFFLGNSGILNWVIRHSSPKGSATQEFVSVSYGSWPQRGGGECFPCFCFTVTQLMTRSHSLNVGTESEKI